MAARIDAMDDADDVALQARDDAAVLERLYRQYYDRVFRYCVRRLFLKEVAEDVTSTVFLKVARNVRSVRDAEERAIRNWLYTITSNEINTCIRSTKQRARLLEAASRARPVAEVQAPDNQDHLDWPVLYKGIMKLKLKYQTVIMLRFFEGLEHEEIAAILSCRQGTTRVMLKRALDKLRKQLGTSGDEEDWR